MERKKACSLCFLGVKNVWTGFKTVVKILEIKGAEMLHLINVAEINAQQN